MNGDQPLIRADDPDAPIARRGGAAISRRQYLADVAALAALLPASGPMLNTTADRYRFAVGLGAAMLRGHTNLMPPNHTPDTVGRLQRLFPGSYVLTDDRARSVALPIVWQNAVHAPLATDVVEPPWLAASAVTAEVLTSGSTGAPVPHAKRWGLLVRNTDAGARRLAEMMGRGTGTGVDAAGGPPASAGPGAALAGVTLVATVPPQHMYGFESTVLIAMLAGAAFDTERPFFPVDIAEALVRSPRPRMLVTTPFHLKMLLDSGILMPQIDLTVCATAPLPPQLAARAEAALGAPLMEIYGCTEAGQVATRRPTEGPEWHTYDGLRLTGDGDRSVVSGGHVPEPTRLADVLEVLDPQTFRLLGRANDLLNIAGKRSSLGHLNHHLNSIEGVQDGAFWLPPEPDAERAAGVVRLAAFVVAPDLSTEALLTALRHRIDPAFLPRPIVFVDALPREATGKLPTAVLAAWAEPKLRRGAPPRSA